MKRAVALVLLLACRAEKSPPQKAPPAPTPAATPAAQVDPYEATRNKMVDDTIANRGIKDPRVLAAMRKVHRHRLVPPDLQPRAYEDNPLPIGFEQTISQPYVVAAMTEAAQLQVGEKALEIGTGSGYQAAVLAELGGVEVYSIEIVEPLARRADATLRRLGFEHVHVRHGDGYFGWADAAPFDAIMITCATPEIPHPLFMQLKTGGKIIAPVGDDEQELRVLTKTEDGVEQQSVMPVRFGPMTGEIDKHR